jgi:ribosome-binding protein aMBF1 (putative translation factor)
MDHQQWDPVILKKTNPNATKVTTTVPKQHINKAQSAIKTEKIYDPNNPDAEPEIKPVMIDSEFGKQIATARCAKNMTQKQLAAAINLPVNVINEYERGQGVRNGTYVSKIKSYLGIHK